jgi:hypothetical protein
VTSAKSRQSPPIPGITPAVASATKHSIRATSLTIVIEQTAQQSRGQACPVRAPPVRRSILSAARGEGGQVPQPGGQAGQLVAVEAERGEGGEVPQPGGQPGQLPQVNARQSTNKAPPRRSATSLAALKTAATIRLACVDQLRLWRPWHAFGMAASSLRRVFAGLILSHMVKEQR